MKTAHAFALAGALILVACGDDEDASSTPATPREVVATMDTSTPSEPDAEINFGPYQVANAREAIETANGVRVSFLATVNVSDYMAMSADERPPERDAIILLNWPYGPCTDAASLLPPPLYEWGLYWDMSKGEWTVEPDRASLAYSYIDQTLEPRTPAYRNSAKSVHVNISSGSPTVQSFRDMINNEQLRSVMLDAGPFNYPVQKGPINQTLLGDYLVLVEGPDEEAKDYFEQIIRCGIESGMIAEGVDPATLTMIP